MKYVLPVATIVLIAGVCLFARQGYAQRQQSLKDFMGVKLKLAQKALEGLVLEDYPMVVKSAQEMRSLSLDETWQVMTTAEYLEFSRQFRDAADALQKAGKKQSLGEASKAYQQVTISCVECHKYVRDIRMAKLGK